MVPDSLSLSLTGVLIARPLEARGVVFVVGGSVGSRWLALQL